MWSTQERISNLFIEIKRQSWFANELKEKSELFIFTVIVVLCPLRNVCYAFHLSRDINGVIWRAAECLISPSSASSRFLTHFSLAYGYSAHATSENDFLHGQPWSWYVTQPVNCRLKIGNIPEGSEQFFRYSYWQDLFTAASWRTIPWIKHEF